MTLMSFSIALHSLFLSLLLDPAPQLRTVLHMLLVPKCDVVYLSIQYGLNCTDVVLKLFLIALSYLWL